MGSAVAQSKRSAVQCSAVQCSAVQHSENGRVNLRAAERRELDREVDLYYYVATQCQPVALATYSITASGDADTAAVLAALVCQQPRDIPTKTLAAQSVYITNTHNPVT